MYQEIPLSKLVPSDRNVRRVPPSKEAQKELEASIKAHGLKQNLVVVPHGKTKFAVTAGGRRLAALNALAARKDIPKSYPVPCLVEADDAATATSLAENMKAGLHPADEAEAYGRMVAEGKTVKEIAAAFGVTGQQVQRRLKIANVAADILAAYRKGELDNEDVQAFAVTDNQEKQLAAYEQLRPNRLHPYHIRQLLTATAIEADDRLVKLVGLDNYKSRGGAVSTDLFENKVLLEDRELVEAMAQELMQAEADRLLPEGWKWVDINLEARHDVTHLYPSRINARSAAKKALAGVCIFCSNTGTLHLTEGLVKKADMKAAFPASKKKKDTAEGVETTDPQAVVQDLKNYRQQALQAYLIGRPDLAQELLHWRVADQVLRDSPSWGAGIGLTADPVNFQWNRPPESEEDTNAGRDLALAHGELNIEWIGHEEPDDRFRAWRALSAPDRQKITTYCMAVLLGQGTEHFGAMIASEMDFRVSDYWRHTVDNYYSRLNKSQLLALATKHLGEEWAATHAGKKKGELVELISSAEAMENFIPECLTWHPTPESETAPNE